MATIPAVASPACPATAVILRRKEGEKENMNCCAGDSARYRFNVLIDKIFHSSILGAMKGRIVKKCPPRLYRVFSRFPIYYITFNTMLREDLLSHPAIENSFLEYVREGIDRGAATGRYVIMPDHVHMFVRMGGDISLGTWMKGLKRALGKTLIELGHQPTRLDKSKLTSFWQPGFFDHVMRSTESYEEKWLYVWNNPVRAGLVKHPEDWPYQGEVVRIHAESL